jgi:glycosyltransferase involved in cell wall biosynthesis
MQVKHLECVSNPLGNNVVYLMIQPAGPTDGITRYARSLTAALLEQGVAVRLATLGQEPLPGPLVWFASRLGYDLKTFFRTYPIVMPAHVVRGGDFLHLSAQTQATVLAFRRKARPVIITVHDLITLLFQNDGEIGQPMKSYDKVFTELWARGLRRADALIADSECTRRDTINRLKIPPEKVHVVDLGIDHSKFRPVVVEPGFYDRYGLQQTTPYVVYVGSEGPRKNLRRLIKAFARVIARVPEARLLKVGASPYRGGRAELYELIEREGIGGKVLFVDDLEDGELASFYSLATVFVFPSLYEGFGLPPLEAMACGAPVIASDRSSLPEVLGDAAVLCNPYDIDELASRIISVLEDAQLRANLKERGLKRASAYTWERTARETIAVYRQAIGR